MGMNISKILKGILDVRFGMRSGMMGGHMLNVTLAQCRATQGTEVTWFDLKNLR